MAYTPANIEKKWQDHWDRTKVFEAKNGDKRPKYYALDMFPYPSSSGLHVGHPEGYTATDILSRYKRAKGFNVLHPMGWDAFGLPAEQYAIQTGVHPAKTTQAAIESFTRQLKALGFSYDWSRQFSTADPKYYKWTQRLFLELYKRGLVERAEAAVNWCPALKTVLANDEVVDGKSERGGHPVERVPMKQWMLKITTYAERLLRDLDRVDWPESTKELQRNWIGRSEGLQIRFPVADSKSELEIYTTRPDTIYGATFMVVAPEHPIVNEITTSAQRSAVEAYKKKAAAKSEVARQEDAKEKTGVATGGFAINPLNQQKIPIWIADYVMMTYGTGAIMAVPAHDERDHAFAKTFSLPVVEVVQEVVQGEKREGAVFTGEGISINSGMITGLRTLEAIEKIIAFAEEKKIGKRAVKYKLRDWLFSRQRYWGEPFPLLIGSNGDVIPLAIENLPVELPSVQNYEPTSTGLSPLAAATEWVNQDPRGKRVTDTMPGSAGSSWYFFRYCDPHNSKEPWSAEAEKYWMPVDLYLGGPEHAVGHLLYSRFWTKVFFDAGLCSVDEPFQKLVHQGMILGEDGEKMSKSRGNVINPDSVVEKYGADTLRLYEMFMGPLDKDKPWSTTAIEGTFRFLQRTWRACVDDSEKCLVTDSQPTDEDLKITHKTIKKVTEDIEHLRFNTAISQMMVFINHFTKQNTAPKACFRPFVQILNPFAPHIAEELWQRIGEKEELTYAAWPKFDPALAKDDKITLAIQVLGKTRGTLEVEPGSDQATVEAQAKTVSTVVAHLEGKTIRKVIFVKDKIINFVV